MKIKMFSKTLFQYLPAFCRLSHSIFCLEIESIDNFDKSHRKAQLKISQWVVKNFKWNLLVLRPDTGSGEIQLCNKTKIDLGRTLIRKIWIIETLQCDLACVTQWCHGMSVMWTCHDVAIKIGTALAFSPWSSLPHEKISTKPKNMNNPLKPLSTCLKKENVCNKSHDRI